ncbi:hypothetical protein GGTG_10409 [Gaeumannomyces tritici R3-111a-1]|uniref:Tf2-1-like SH3-like domain-containing protein n=1 Tax=Gaeumannomyces tritici (strain R3-111a-1) TaxID=644352 RepID=J3PA83_GAET3|nr:hypothetical protein GGTG_10409 [Gaeumannomyces tritici R3-111a-1]EJT71149.1 hypothetical protein GGTG_10409 [Gaeumannomyces tritici R3-111a-1]
MYKKYYNKGRTPVLFGVSDWVLLSTANIKIKRPLKKLSNKWLKLFQILKMVGLTGLAFRLKLPVNYQIYNVFPANLLRAFKKRPGEKPKNKKPKIERKKKDRFEVKALLKYKKLLQKRKYLVKWISYDESKNLIRKIPDFSGRKISCFINKNIFRKARKGHAWRNTLKQLPYFKRSGKCMSAVFKPIKGRKKSILKLFIKALKLNCASNFALNALLDNGLTFVTRKLFGRYGIKRFGFLNGLAGAKLGFNKLFEKFRYCFGQSLVNVLICLTTKTTVTKYRTLRIIVFKKGQINRVLIIALLKIDNFLQRERVANTYVKRGKGNVRFKGRSIGIKSVAAALVARFTLFFGGGLFAAAVKTRRGVTGKTFAGVLKGCKRKRAR